MAKDINKEVFDESTKLKLDIFGECFEEWFPVFLHERFTEKIVIFDFFAGSGMDIQGTHGSPLVLLKNARGENRKYCRKTQKPVSFVFNEFEKEKTEALNNNVYSYLSKCREENGCAGGCTYHVDIKQSDFKDLFMSSEI